MHGHAGWATEPLTFMVALVVAMAGLYALTLVLEDEPNELPPVTAGDLPTIDTDDEEVSD